MENKYHTFFSTERFSNTYNKQKKKKNTLWVIADKDKWNKSYYLLQVSLYYRTIPPRS